MAHQDGYEDKPKIDMTVQMEIFHTNREKTNKATGKKFKNYMGDNWKTNHQIQ